LQYDDVAPGIEITGFLTGMNDVKKKKREKKEEKNAPEV
jgi:hypothetical protein